MYMSSKTPSTKKPAKDMVKPVKESNMPQRGQRTMKNKAKKK
jgi:hypothetical protein